MTALTGQPAPLVLHFVTGGFSGATQVALTLVRAARGSGRMQARLVLRRKSGTDTQRVQALRDEGLAVDTVPGFAHVATVVALARLCRRLRPAVLVSHGFSEHLWGRYAGLLAGVPALVHVEHNSRERYSRWRLAQARWLARRTDAIVGCSEGVRQVLLALGFPADKVSAIANGVAMAPFSDAAAQPFAQRQPGLVMVARFARQKDHATLLDALALLRRRGLQPTALLVGGGSTSHERAARTHAARLGLGDQVRFAGQRSDVPQLLGQHQLCVLSTHWEGMPLALVEGMAAGCAVVGSAVPGVRELLVDGDTGRLVPPGDAAALADTLAALLTDPAAAERMAQRGRRQALAQFSVERMSAEYERLLLQLAGHAP